MSEQHFIRIGTTTRGGIIAIADHASNRVPEGMELGIPAELMDQHVAIDIGTAGVAEVFRGVISGHVVVNHTRTQCKD